MARRLVLAALALGAAALAAAPGAVPRAHAHALCADPDPGHGATVAAAPERVSCNFTEPLAPGSSDMTVVDRCGRRVDDGDVRVLLREMSVSVTGTGPGRYDMRWTTVSAADGHQSEGTVQFTVAGAPQPCPGEAAAAGQNPQPAAGSGTPSAAAPPTPAGAGAPASRPTPAGGPESPAALTTGGHGGHGPHGTMPSTVPTTGHGHHVKSAGSADDRSAGAALPRRRAPATSHAPEALAAAAGLAAGAVPLLRRRVRAE